MKKRPTRRWLLSVLSLLLAAAMLLTGALPVSAASRISPKENFTPGEATLTELRAFFQNGAYWNHVSGTEDTPYSVTDTPCSPYTDSDGMHRDEGVVCNYFGIPGVVWGGWQCCGFTRLMTYLYFGTSCDNWETSTSLTGMKAGDVLYLTNGGPHYIWLLSVTDNGDGTKKVTYTDCNGAGRRVHCQIQWDARCTVNMQTQELELAAIGAWDVVKRYVAPGDARTVLPESNKTPPPSRTYTVTYADGQGKTSDKKAVTADVTLPPCSFRREGYTFAGWTVQRASDGAWLCGNEWDPDATADGVTRFAAGAKLAFSLLATGTDEAYIVTAAWTENRLTVRYHPNGGQFLESTYTADADTGVVARSSTQEPVQDEWTCDALASGKNLPDPADWGLARTGYTCVGWSRAPAYKTTATAAGLYDRLLRQSGEETWYAVWVPNLTEVWYRTDAGTVDSDDYQLYNNGRITRRDHVGWAITRFFFNDPLMKLPTAEELGLKRDGYTFVGWTANGKTIIGESGLRRMMTDRFRLKVELTAVWEKEADT
ncbi:MAG: InlB B-repeat-containing protein [Clostridia bacterium]|nr:InlB B-repeat-containing protein [Clostridia bacterium]